MSRKTGLFVTGVFVVMMSSWGVISIWQQSGTQAPVAASIAWEMPNFEGRKLTLLVTSPHVAAAALQAQWFHKQTGAVVERVVTPYDELLKTIVADLSGRRPRFDVFPVWYPELPALVDRGFVADLTEFIARNADRVDPDDFIPSLYDAYTLYQGRRWALPWDGDTQILFYRKSLLAKYGFAPPKLWSEYQQIARQITESERDNGIYGSAIMGVPVPVLIVSSFMNRLATLGGALVDEQGQPRVDSDEAVAALEMLIEHSKYALPTPLETDFDAARMAFLSGRVAMVEQWTDIGIHAEDPNQSVIQGDWGAVQLPRGRDTGGHAVMPLSGGFALAVSTRAPNAEVARAFVRFATRADIALRSNMIVDGGLDPTRISTLNSPAYQAFAPEVAAAKQRSLRQVSPWPRDAAMLERLARHLALAVEGKAAPRAALEAVQRDWLASWHAGGLQSATSP